MGNGKIEYYTDFDCTEPCKKLQVSGMRNLYVVEISYKENSSEKIIRFRMPYGEFSLAFNRYEFELDQCETYNSAPFGFSPYAFVFSVETYSMENMMYKDVLMSKSTWNRRNW